MTPTLEKIRILRLIHIENLPILLRRIGLHAPNFNPNDGLKYKTIHHVDIQQQRKEKRMPCGPGGVVHDYIPFYFGYLSPMLFTLGKGNVSGYNEGQEPLIYLVSTAAHILKAGLKFVFSDGHGNAFNTDWYDDPSDLNQVDWEMVNQRYWADDLENDMDRKRRKQAEFLVHQFCHWDKIIGIAVINDRVKSIVEQIFSNYDSSLTRPVLVKRDWYY